MLKRMAILGVLLLGLAACNRADVSVQRNASGGATITVTVSESEINTAIADALATSNPLLRDPQIDLQPGKIVVTGEHDQRDGSGRVSGSLTLSLSVQDGALLATVTDAQIQGLDLSDASIAEFNSRLAERLTTRAGRENRVVKMTSVNITDGEIQFTFETGG
jgi:LmeA-like phospholipid-binding